MNDESPEPPHAPKPRVHWAAIAAAGVALLIFAAVLSISLVGKNRFVAAAGPPTVTAVPVCSTADGKKVGDLVEQYAQQWDDANALTISLSRMTMAPQVAELQKIRRDVQAQFYPECGKKAQSALVLSMDGYINGYIAFLRQDPDSTVSTWFAVGRKGMDDFGVELAALSGAPASPSPSATATVKR